MPVAVINNPVSFVNRSIPAGSVPIYTEEQGMHGKC